MIIKDASDFMESDPDAAERIKQMTSIMLDAGDSIGESPIEIMQALSACFAIIICNNMGDKYSADEILRLFSQVVGLAVKAADDDGSAIWHRKNWN